MIMHRSDGATALFDMAGFVVGAHVLDDGEWWLLVETTADVIGCPDCGVRAVGHGCNATCSDGSDGTVIAGNHFPTEVVRTPTPDALDEHVHGDEQVVAAVQRFGIQLPQARRERVPKNQRSRARSGQLQFRVRLPRASSPTLC